MDIPADRYQSPFSWRYGSPEMRQIWSELEKRRAWRRCWAALAAAQAEQGLILPHQLEEIQAHVDQVDLHRALAIEADIHHDLMAELRTFAEQCPAGGGALHLGATSMDIEDNADALRLRASLSLLLRRLDGLLWVLASRCEETAGDAVIAFTHLQPAEPTTLGYRLAFTAQDVLADRQQLAQLGASVRGKGFKGAVGTGAAYMDLLSPSGYAQMEERASALLDLPFFPITHQTAPRRQEYAILQALASLAAALAKFAFDVRLLQSPPVGELAEPFGAHQVGSSAMPFKRNPIQAEKMNSLARWVAQLPRLAWDHAANSLLERTLDDSAARRGLLPEAFLATEELVLTATRILRDLRLDREAQRRNLARYAPFAATERVLMALARAGADRQAMHERLRGLSLRAWAAVQAGEDNPLASLLLADDAIGALLPAGTLEALMDVSSYTGIAAQRARELATRIRSAVPEPAQ